MNYFSLLSLGYFSHSFILLFCCFLLVFLGFISYFLFFNFSLYVSFLFNFNLEYFWTLFPIILILILFLPIYFYYNIFSISSSFFIFVLANQWFWDFSFINSVVTDFPLFDFFIYNNTVIYLPFFLQFFTFYLTSVDVLHAFSIPSLYLMIDLVPGMLFTIIVFFPISGFYQLYCNQICGLNHSLMTVSILVS